MSVYLEPGEPGLAGLIVLDGEALAVSPGQIDSPVEPVADYQDMMDGGSRAWERRPHFNGVADVSDRFQFGVPYESLVDVATIKQLKLARVKGGIHTLAIWTYEPILFTCLAGQQTYYLPRFRRCAPHVYDGLALGEFSVSTVAFPTLAYLNDVALTVTYDVGPTLSTPGAGGIVIASAPETSGAAKDYTPMLLGDTVVDDDVLKIWTIPIYQVTMQGTGMTYRGINERHAYTFVEI